MASCRSLHLASNGLQKGVVGKSPIITAWPLSDARLQGFYMARRWVSCAPVQLATHSRLARRQVCGLKYGFFQAACQPPNLPSLQIPTQSPSPGHLELSICPDLEAFVLLWSELFGTTPSRRLRADLKQILVHLHRYSTSYSQIRKVSQKQ